MQWFHNIPAYPTILVVRSEEGSDSPEPRFLSKWMSLWRSIGVYAIPDSFQHQGLPIYTARSGLCHLSLTWTFVVGPEHHPEHSATKPHLLCSLLCDTLTGSGQCRQPWERPVPATNTKEVNTGTALGRMPKAQQSRIKPVFAIICAETEVCMFFFL